MLWTKQGRHLCWGEGAVMANGKCWSLNGMMRDPAQVGGKNTTWCGAIKPDQDKEAFYAIQAQSQALEPEKGQNSICLGQGGRKLWL